MKEIPIAIPPSLQCKVTGSLVESQNYDDLSQDMLEVITPSGVLIDVGWVPEFSPEGRYLVTVSQGMHEITAPMQTASVHAAAQIVESLARQFSGGIQLTPSTSPSTS